MLASCLAGLVIGMATIHYAVELPDSVQRKLIADSEALPLGTSVTDVVKRLGKPQVDRELVKKKGDFLARELTYYLRRVDPVLVNLHDEYISFRFDRDDKLVKKLFHGTRPSQ
jgi:hypothetical protein